MLTMRRASFVQLGADEKNNRCGYRHRSLAILIPGQSDIWKQGFQHLPCLLLQRQDLEEACLVERAGSAGCRGWGDFSDIL